MFQPAVTGRAGLSLFAAAAVSLAALIVGCGGSDSPPTSPGNPGAGDALVAQANAQLADILFAELNSPDPEQPSDIDVRPALALYQQALAVQPTHRQANFGVAILNLIALTSDAEVNDAFDEWEAYLASRTPFELGASRRRPLGVPLFLEEGTRALRLPADLLPLSVAAQQRSVLGAPDPQLSRIQAILRDLVIPRLAEARTRLGTAAVPGFVFWVTPRMQGDKGADSVEIDRTDLLALKAACGLLQAGCHTAVAYQLGMTAYDSLSLHQSIQQNSGWLTFATGGASYVTSTDDLLVGAADDADGAISSLLEETDPQDDDVIRLGPGGASEVEDLRDDLDEFRAAFGSQGIVRTGDWDGDSGTPDVALQISAGAWFTSPVSNLKSLLPDYSGSVVRRPHHTSQHYDPVMSSIDATVPSAGFYSGYVTVW